MNRFDLLTVVKNSTAKATELFASPTTGVYGRMDSQGQFVNDFARVTPRPLSDPKAVAPEVTDVAERLRAEARERNNKFLKERYGIEMGGGFEDRSPEDLAALVTTCAEWAQAASEVPFVDQETLYAHVSAIRAALPGSLGFRMCRSLVRQSLGALVRAAGVAPDMAARLSVLEVRGVRSHEDQMRVDKLLEASTEAAAAARPMLALARAIEDLSQTQGFTDHKGQRVTLESFHELAVSVADLEIKSRKGKAKYALQGDDLKAALAKIDKESPLLTAKMMEFLAAPKAEEDPESDGAAEEALERATVARDVAAARAEEAKIRVNYQVVRDLVGSRFAWNVLVNMPALLANAPQEAGVWWTWAHHLVRPVMTDAQAASLGGEGWEAFVNKDGENDLRRKPSASDLAVEERLEAARKAESARIVAARKAAPKTLRTFRVLEQKAGSSMRLCRAVLDATSAEAAVVTYLAGRTPVEGVTYTAEV